MGDTTESCIQELSKFRDCWIVRLVLANANGWRKRSSGSYTLIRLLLMWFVFIFHCDLACTTFATVFYSRKRSQCCYVAPPSCIFLFVVSRYTHDKYTHLLTFYSIEYDRPPGGKHHAMKRDYSKSNKRLLLTQFSINRW